MADPECADAFIGIGKSAVFCQRVREEGGIEIQPNSSFFGKFDPFCKMFGANLVAWSDLSVLVNTVACVNGELVFAGDKRECFV